MRVWRDWLSKQCASRTFSDHSAVIVQHGDTVSLSGKAAEESQDISKDSSVLWVSTMDKDLGLRLKVMYKRRTASALPLMYSNDIEVAVSYVVEFQGESRNQVSDHDLLIMS